MFLVLSAKIKTFFELLIFLLSFSSVLMNSSFTFRNFTFSSSFARSSSKGLRSATCGALCLVLKPYVFVGCVLVLLSKSNFNVQLEYEQQNNTRKRHNRQCNVLWYNPPYSKNVKTNLAQNFLQLIDKHFPPNNKLNKLFNRHTVRVSYSCNENMRTFISRHNKTILKNQDRQNKTNETRDCNCRQNRQCPIEGKCLQTNVVYKADITTTDNNDTKTYIGVTSNDFKTRYRNHCKSINNIKYRNETELSKHIWQIKENGRSYEVKWGIIKQFTTPVNSKKCYLCLEEKLLILKSRKKLLNKRSDLFNTCRHVTLNH